MEFQISQTLLASLTVPTFPLLILKDQLLNFFLIEKEHFRLIVNDWASFGNI